MKTRPMGIIERVRLEGRGALPGDAATDVTTGFVDSKYAGTD